MPESGRDEGDGLARESAAPLPGMRPYVLSLVHTEAVPLEIRGPNVPQHGQDAAKGAAHRRGRSPVLHPRRILDAQPSTFWHWTRLGNICSRAHNRIDALSEAPHLKAAMESEALKSTSATALIFIFHVGWGGLPRAS